MLPQIPLDAAEQPRHPPALSLEEGDPEPRIKLEDATQHQRDQGELHFGRMTGNMAHKAILAKARLDRRVIRPGPFMKAQRDIVVL